MSIQHKNIPEAQLHEPKGASTAASGSVYVADGAGSGSWTDVLATLNNRNIIAVAGSMTDASTPSNEATIPNPGIAGKLIKVIATSENNFTGGANVLTARIASANIDWAAATATDLSLSLAHSTGVNQTVGGLVSSGNSVSTNQCVLVRSDGGGTGTAPLRIVCLFDVST